MFWLLEHRRFAEYKKDRVCFRDALPSLVEDDVKQLLSPDSNISGGEDVVKARRVYGKEMVVLASRRRYAGWTVTPRLVPVQKSSVHIMHFFWNVYKVATLFGKCLYIPLSNCLYKW